MKVVHKKSKNRRAIAFLTVVISLFSCTACDPDVSLKPQVTISSAENVTITSATIVAYVIPNEDNTVVSFEYQANGSTWVVKTLPSKFTGTDKVKVTLDLSDLQASTLYNFKVTATNSAGSTPSSVSSFTTDGLTKAMVVINAAQNIKISSAKISAVVIPNQDNSTIVFEYQEANSTWQTQTLGTTFSGKDSLKVNFDLSALKPNMNYNFRVKVSNKAGEVISSVSSFTTYAVSDYDGNLYHTVTIGTQTWVKENLRTTHYANGDPIANVTDGTQWGNLSSAAYCWYNNDAELGKVYGALYNWWVGADPRGLIIGWHTPSSTEFRILSDYLDNSNNSLSGLMMMETGHTHWGVTGREATNSSGFTALPNGARGIANGQSQHVYTFEELSISAYFWNVTDGGIDGGAAYISTKPVCTLYLSYYFEKKNGFGLRLLK